MNKSKKLNWLYLIVAIVLLALTYHSWDTGHISYRGIRILENEPLYWPILILGFLGGVYTLFLAMSGIFDYRKNHK